MENDPHVLSKPHIETYQDARHILVAVDNVIFGFDPEDEVLKVLLFKRLVEPEAGGWSLIGSFVQPDESAVAAAARILHKFTGLKDVFLEQFITYSDVERDPGARVISISYYSLIQINEHDRDLVAAHNAQWFDVREIPDLVIDHSIMVNDALVKIRENARFKPIGFNLLPEKFTLPKLFKLYQSIMSEPLDDRNFRKKILASGVLDKLEEKDKSTSKKGAYLYKFNEEKYFQLVRDGYNVLFH